MLADHAEETGPIQGSCNLSAINNPNQKLCVCHRLSAPRSSSTISYYLACMRVHCLLIASSHNNAHLLRHRCTNTTSKVEIQLAAFPFPANSTSAILCILLHTYIYQSIYIYILCLSLQVKAGLSQNRELRGSCFSASVVESYGWVTRIMYNRYKEM